MENPRKKFNIGSVALASILAIGTAALWVVLYLIFVVAIGTWMRHGPLEPATKDWILASVLLSPLFFSAIAFVVMPLQALISNTASSFYFAFSEQALQSIPQFLVLCALSVILAILCYRRQRRYSERGAILWAFFVLLLGVPAFVGYLLHRRWPLRETCANCHKPTPRNRDTCLNCAAEFPLPAMKGIEVFA